MRWMVIAAAAMFLAGCAEDAGTDTVGPETEGPATDGARTPPVTTSAPPNPTGTPAPDAAAEDANATRGPQVTRGGGGSLVAASPPGALMHFPVGILSTFSTAFDVPDDAVALVAEMSYSMTAGTGASLDLYGPDGATHTTAGDIPAAELSGTATLRIDDPEAGGWTVQCQPDGAVVALACDLAVSVFFTEPEAGYTAL